MKFTTHEKEIIRKIAEGKVYNIASYLETFGLTTKRKLDESDIEARMRQEEQGTTYKKVKDGVDRFVNVTTTNALGLSTTFPTPRPLTDEDLEDVEAVIDYTGSKITVDNAEGTEYVYNLREGITCTNSFSDIKRFLTIWQFLKSENLVLEVDSKISKEDYEVFFEYKAISETKWAEKNKPAISLPKKYEKVLEELQNQPFLAGSDSARFKNFRNYIEYICVYNKENEIICSQFIGKQIIANADLDLFVKRKFRTKEQRSLLLSLVPAYLALVLTLGVTVWQECNNTTDKQLEQIQNHLVQMEQTLKEKEFEETVLDDIESKLGEIELVITELSAEENEEKIIEKLEALLQEIRLQE